MIEKQDIETITTLLHRVDYWICQVTCDITCARNKITTRQTKETDDMISAAADAIKDASTTVGWVRQLRFYVDFDYITTHLKQVRFRLVSISSKLTEYDYSITNIATEIETQVANMSIS